MFVCLFAFPLSDFALVAFPFGNHSVQYAVEVWVVSLPLEPTRVLSRLGCEAGGPILFNSCSRSDTFEVFSNVDI